MEKKDNTWRPEGVLPLCPVCGRELTEDKLQDDGWHCKCGETIPKKLVIEPFEGCTHGRNCNCGRERKK
jgi:tRNA(Ile2) C34 agmatinyltransferase TiaS